MTIFSSVNKEPTNSVYFISIFFSRYEVMLKVKANKSRSSPEMWRYANVKFHTLSEPPKRSPEIDPGAFHIDNNDCAHVFWQDIPEYSRNGTGFTYILNASRRDTPGSG